MRDDGPPRTRPRNLANRFWDHPGSPARAERSRTDAACALLFTHRRARLAASPLRNRSAVLARGTRPQPRRRANLTADRLPASTTRSHDTAQRQRPMWAALPGRAEDETDESRATRSKQHRPGERRIQRPTDHQSEPRRAREERKQCPDVRRHSPLRAPEPPKHQSEQEARLALEHRRRHANSEEHERRQQHGVNRNRDSPPAYGPAAHGGAPLQLWPARSTLSTSLVRPRVKGTTAVGRRHDGAVGHRHDGTVGHRHDRSLRVEGRSALDATRRTQRTRADAGRHRQRPSASFRTQRSAGEHGRVLSVIELATSLS
jgi:hypothetical protein